MALTFTQVAVVVTQLRLDDIRRRPEAYWGPDPCLAPIKKEKV